MVYPTLFFFIVAEIHEAGTGYGYSLTHSGEFGDTKYNHLAIVDGEDIYGKTIYCFPRRCRVSGSFAMWNSKNDFSGSRCINCGCSLVAIDRTCSTWAEIASTNTSGYRISEYPITEDTVTTKYTHHELIDGDNTYGTTYMAFPRRRLVGGDRVQLVVEYTQYPGSRSMMPIYNTAFKSAGISHTGRDWLL